MPKVPLMNYPLIRGKKQQENELATIFAREL